MDWIQTFSGHRVWPLQAEPGPLEVADIAHSLSLLCRFNGHCRTYYSVAEHSVRVADILPPHLAMWGLMHDAAEAYISDLPRPIKLFFPEFSSMEEQLLRVIAERFGLSWPMPPEVKRADDVLLATERRDLMGHDPGSWGLDVEPLCDPLRPLDPGAAETLFLTRYRELGGEDLEPLHDHQASRSHAPRRSGERL